MASLFRGFMPYIIAFLIFLNIAMAQEYYGDVTISIDAGGNAVFTGLSNHPKLEDRSTQELTSKKGQYWLFNLTLAENFSDFVFRVNFPQDATLNYVKTSVPFRIGSESGLTYIKGSGSNDKIEIVVQYSIAGTTTQAAVKDYSWLYVVGIIAVIFTVALAMTKSRRKRLEKAEAQKHHQQKAAKEPEPHIQTQPEQKIAIEPEPKQEKKDTWYNKHLLTDRQLQIVEILEKHDKPITQKMLETEMNIPKSSLSRNLDSLVARGIVKRENKGMTNAIYINPAKPEP